MKNKYKRNYLVLLVCVLVAVLCIALIACTPQPASNANTSAPSGDTSADALKALHTIGQLDDVTDFSNATCLTGGCHNIASLASATDDFDRRGAQGIAADYNNGLNAGANPHRSHMGNADCTSCHSLNSEPVLTCNNCHFLPLPTDWTDTYDGKGLEQ
ncbi:MAG: cytochrome c3 family protein [Coriobacteriales bacterium]|jgi:hypothetical protein|nr:cytochrome c3 family protein [Coriobacteriales bacterium]